MVSDEPSPLQLRALRPGDSAEVLALERAVFPLDAWTKAAVEAELQSPWSNYVGAFADQGLVGYGGVKGAEELDLMTLAVLPEFRLRGIGRALMQKLVELAGSRPMFLEVRASNLSAIALYRAFGFTPIGKVARYYRHPTEDALTMMRPANAPIV